MGFAPRSPEANYRSKGKFLSQTRQRIPHFCSVWLSPVELPRASFLVKRFSIFPERSGRTWNFSFSFFLFFFFRNDLHVLSSRWLLVIRTRYAKTSDWLKSSVLTCKRCSSRFLSLFLSFFFFSFSFFLFLLDVGLAGSKIVRGNWLVLARAFSATIAVARSVPIVQLERTIIQLFRCTREKVGSLMDDRPSAS